MEIKRVIAENPQMGRSDISKYLCRMWAWQSPTGQLKDIACRDMLRTLDKIGAISLPPPMRRMNPIRQKSRIKHLVHNTDPIRCHLSELSPIHIETINSGSALDEYKSYIDQYHYLGFDRTVGENMKYIAWSNSGTPLACLLFGSAAWSCADRDRFIGWNKEQKAANLMLITNNARFLIYPWINVPNLASHVLSLASRRIAKDWESKYGHDIVCMETFVETGRFYGGCYRAANWIHAGRTQGRGRDGGHHDAILPEKDIYLYPLDKNFRQRLRGE